MSAIDPIPGAEDLTATEPVVVVIDHDILDTLEPEALVTLANNLMGIADSLLPWSGRHPVGRVRWVPIAQVRANDYNPNAVAHHEMRLLHTSISEDGYTQPVVAITEASGDILLPCGHFSPIGQSTADSLIRRLWGTPQVSSMGREASLHLRLLPDAGAGGGSKSASRKGTTAKPSARGSKNSGASDGFTGSKDSASPTSGMSPGSETSSGSSIHVCRTCESSAKRQSTWSSASVVSSPDGSAEEYGLTVRWLSSASTDSPAQPPKSEPSSDVQPMPSGPSGMNSDSPLPRAVVRETSTAVIVDGFHRFTVMSKYADIYDTTGGYLPVVVIDKPLADRIASTVRHNRARGKHSVAGMSNLVFEMLSEGEDDATICQKIGLEPEELARLKHITGYAKLHADHEYRRSFLTQKQIDLKAAWKRDHPTEHVPNNI